MNPALTVTSIVVMISTVYELTRLSISLSCLVRSKDCKPLPSLGLQLLADDTVEGRALASAPTWGRPHPRWAYTHLGKTLKVFSVFVAVPDLMVLPLGMLPRIQLILSDRFLTHRPSRFLNLPLKRRLS